MSSRKPNSITADCAVVIPAYNAGKYIKDAVDSALTCSSSLSLEIIIVDDGSTDNTLKTLLELKQAHPAIQILRQQNTGVAAARNKGLEKVAAPLVCFVDADDRLRRSSLDCMRSALSHRTGAVASFGQCIYIDGSGQVVSLRKPLLRKTKSEIGTKDILIKNLIDTPSAVLFTTRAVREIGGFKAGLRRAQDWEMYTRIAAQGVFVSCDQDVVDYRLHSESATRRAASSLADFEPALEQVFGRGAEFYKLDPRTFAQIEYQSRANLIRFCSLVDRGLLPQARNLANGLENLVRSGFAANVLSTFLRSSISSLFRLW